MGKALRQKKGGLACAATRTSNSTKESSEKQNLQAYSPADTNHHASEGTSNKNRAKKNTTNYSWNIIEDYPKTTQNRETKSYDN